LKIEDLEFDDEEETKETKDEYFDDDPWEDYGVIHEEDEDDETDLS
jgi:hypothetical protein